MFLVPKAAYVIVQSKEMFGDWIRFSVQVQDVFKWGASKVRKGGQDFVWVPQADLRCRCPQMRTKGSYIILGQYERRFLYYLCPSICNVWYLPLWDLTMELRLIPDKFN